MKHEEKWHSLRSWNCSTTTTLWKSSGPFLKSEGGSFSSSILYHIGTCPRGNSIWICPPNESTCNKKTRHACIISSTSSTRQNLTCTVVLYLLPLALLLTPPTPLPRALLRPTPLFAPCPAPSRTLQSSCLGTIITLSHGFQTRAHTYVCVCLGV